MVVDGGVATSDDHCGLEIWFGVEVMMRLTFAGLKGMLTVIDSAFPISAYVRYYGCVGV